MDKMCNRECGRPATNRRGTPVCDQCRGTRTAKELAPRPSKTFKCACGRIYTTVGGNRTCASCLHDAAKHPCPDCGVQIDNRATVCRTCWGKRHKQEAAANWRGGRTVNIHGYILVRVDGHPRATKTNPYVREHHLVMEEVLGRFLLPGENVHHRNGVKADNRPENLELWVKSQPAGQRVVDLLAWARGIIAEYEPIESALQ